MKYYYEVKVKDSFKDAKEKVTEALSKEGFGILSEINVKETFRKKLDVDFDDYIILGACNPGFAYKAFHADNKIGTMLPCNVIVRNDGKGITEVAAIDPYETMKAIDNKDLNEIAKEIRGKLKNALDAIS